MIKFKATKGHIGSSMLIEFNSFPVDHFVPHTVCPYIHVLRVHSSPILLNRTHKKLALCLQSSVKYMCGEKQHLTSASPRPSARVLGMRTAPESPISQRAGGAGRRTAAWHTLVLTA